MRPSTSPPLCLWGGVALLLGALSTQAAFDAFLKIEGVPGESTDSRRSDWIEVHSLQFGLARPSALEPVRLAPLTVRKRLDKASPLLARACATGQHIPRLKLELVRTSVRQSRVYQIILEDVLVTGLDVSGGTADVLLAETVELAATRWSLSYTECELNGNRPLSCPPLSRDAFSSSRNCPEAVWNGAGLHWPRSSSSSIKR